MIKSYLELADIEKNKVLEFISIKLNEKKTLNDIEDMFNNEIYGYGEGSLFYIKDTKVLGKINIILETVEKTGTIYIHSLSVLDGDEEVINELINTAITKANTYNPLEILLGERNEETLKTLENIGYIAEYSALNMVLEDRSIRGKCLELVELSMKNKDTYLDVHNDSFGDTPHGCVLDENQVEEYLNDKEGFYFMVSEGENIIGFVNFKIEEVKGTFDLGLCKRYRGKGYGKQLLETAIDFLNKKEVDKIGLTVIEKNQLAHNMYIKRGFKKESVLSYWIRVK